MKPEKNKVTIGSLLKAIFCVIKVQDCGDAGTGRKLCTGAATRLLGTATARLALSEHGENDYKRPVSLLLIQDFYSNL